MKNKYNINSQKVNIYTLFKNIPSFIYLLPVPIIQNIFYQPRGILEHITSYAFSIFIFLLFGGLSFANYLQQKYRPLDNSTYIEKGFPIHAQFKIPYNRLQSVIIQSSPITKLFSAVRIQLNTPATKAKKGDAVFYLSKHHAKQLLSEIYEDIGYISRFYKAHNWRIFFMSAIWSNPVSGILIIAPFIRNVGKVAGDNLRDELIESFDFSAYLIYIGLPPTTAIIAYFMLFFYVVNVFTNFIRNANFTCTSYQKGIMIKRGCIQRTHFLTNESKLNSITISQSLIMLPSKLFSVYIHTAGSGKTKGDKSLLIAAENRDNIKHLLSQFFANLNLHFDYLIKPSHKALKSYLRLPFIFLLVDSLFSIIIQSFNLYNDISFTFSVFSIPWLLFWCVFRIIAFHKSAVSFNGQYVFVRSYRKLTFNATLIPINKVQLCVMSTNIFQKIAKTCNIRIYIFGEKRTYVEIKHIEKGQAVLLLNQINKTI